MTVVFDTFRTKPGAFGYEKYVIASQCAHWRGNPYPSLRSNVSAHRVDNVTPVNDHLPLQFLSGEPKGCGMNTSAKARIVSGDPPHKR